MGRIPGRPAMAASAPAGQRLCRGNAQAVMSANKTRRAFSARPGPEPGLLADPSCELLFPNPFNLTLSRVVNQSPGVGE
jgi:hypothetical protein